MTVNGAVSSGDLFAFYGLLKQGADGMPGHIDLERAGEFLAPCRVIGRLHDLGGFPGLVSGDMLCHALLYRIDDTSIVAALDEFEDVVADDPRASLYLRIKSPVFDAFGEPIGDQAWIYWYNQSVVGFPPVADGNWPLRGGHRPAKREDA